MAQETVPQLTHLPAPERVGDISVETAIARRRSVRHFRDAGLRLKDLGQLLWAAQGITDDRGFRASPSAGALYPLELYAVVGNVSDLSPGIYRYLPGEHGLVQIAKGNRRDDVCRAALGQESIRTAPAVVIFCAVYERTTKKYGARGIRYVHMEIGHAAQNLFLQAVSIGLATVPVGAFHDRTMKDVLGCPADEHPLYIMPVGR